MELIQEVEMKVRKKARRRFSREEALRAEIDEVLEVDFVEWDRVYEYTNRLDSLLNRIKWVGKTSPRKALELVLFFIMEIPWIFNNVHDECELEMFCHDLAESALSLMKKSGVSPKKTTACLMDAFIGDWHETCRFDDVPDILARARLSKKDRTVMAEVVLSYRGKEKEDANILEALVDKLLGCRPLPERSAS
jgi:hypothetical protein